MPSLILDAAVGTDSTGRIHRRTVPAAPDPALVALSPWAEVAVWVAARRVRLLSETAGMPLIDVTYDGTVGEEVLHRLAEVLADAVAEAADCPEEPWIGPPGPGDIEIRFRKKSQLDVSDLDVVIEVRTKLFGHRVQDKQRRADLIRDRISSLPLGRVGVWLILSDGAWSQS
jgi:hypothetical protein